MSRYGQRSRSGTAISTWTQANLMYPRIEVDYLVVGGGGGAVRTSYSTQGKAVAQADKINVLNQTVTVVIGGGGASSGSAGSSSSISSASIALIESLGGGYPISDYGAGAGNSSTSQTGGTYGYNGGSTTAGVVRGGGGGAGEAGNTDANGAGGDGITVSITGSAVVYGGGGGGSGDGGNFGIAGDGGGGRGSTYSYGAYDSTGGTANTGGGAGGSGGGNGDSNGKSGGSGVVIFRYPSTVTITVGAGLTADATGTDGSFSYKRITAGSGTVSWA
jgi:hypothetical protein